MKAARFDYIRPASVGDAIASLGSTGAKPVSGGQSLGPMLNLRLARPSVLVDLARLSDLRAVRESDGGVHFGAAITHAEFEDAIHPDPTNGILSKVASGIAYRAVRNRGTIGGSLAHADPAADWPTVLLALGASVEIMGPRGKRTSTIDDLIRGAFETSLDADEIITSVFVPRLSSGARWAYVKSCRKVGEFAESMCAILVDPANGVSRIVIGAIERKQIIGNTREAVSDPDWAINALAAAGLGDDPATNRLHRATIARAIHDLQLEGADA